MPEHREGTSCIRERVQVKPIFITANRDWELPAGVNARVGTIEQDTDADVVKEAPACRTSEAAPRDYRRS
jgi:hypothetical protein